MDKVQLLTAYREITASCFPVWDWELDNTYRIISTSCPYASTYKKLMLWEGRRKALESHRQRGNTPLILVTPIMLSWILVFDKDPDADSSIYIKGPYFSLTNDPLRYDEMLNNSRMPERTRCILRDSLRTLPALSNQSAMELAQMLHYCVNHETISTAEVSTYMAQRKGKNNERVVESDQFERSSILWQMEQEILDKVRRGDLSISDVFTRGNGSKLGYAYSNKQEDIQKYRRQLGILLTLVSRAAVEGGLPKKTSFPLCTKYRKVLDACTSVEELQVLSSEIINNYARQVHRVKKLSACSSRIKLCCEYINTHPEEKLMLSTLAEKAGYTESYLSRKFVQEMGCSITDYIQQAKVERSKFLLINTEYTVDEISDILGFGSRSYFSNVFKKVVGESPTQFRRQNKIV